MTPKSIISQTFITMSVIVLVIISSAIETDIFVPTFPILKDYFATTESKIQMILSVNFLGLCISSLWYGPLSDVYGRKKVLLAGMALFAFSSVACVWVSSFEHLLFWRFIQGLGGSVAFIVPSAMIYDIFDKEKAAKLQGLYNSIITFAMSLAPIIGGILYLTFNWRANFIFVAALSSLGFIFSVFFVHETLAKDARTSMHFPTILNGYKKLLLSSKAMGNLYIVCVVSGAYFAYISNLSLIFINHLGVSANVFGYYQAAILLIFACVSGFSARIITRQGLERTCFTGKIITVSGAVLLLWITLFAPMPLTITIGMSIFTAGFALNMGIFFGDYMEVYPEIRGIASSLANSFRLIMMSGTVALSSYFFNGTMIPVAIIIFVAGTSSLAVMYGMQKKHGKS